MHAAFAPPLGHARKASARVTDQGDHATRLTMQRATKHGQIAPASHIAGAWPLARSDLVWIATRLTAAGLPSTVRGRESLSEIEPRARAARQSCERGFCEPVKTLQAEVQGAPA